MVVIIGLCSRHAWLMLQTTTPNLFSVAVQFIDLPFLILLLIVALQVHGIQFFHFSGHHHGEQNGLQGVQFQLQHAVDDHAFRVHVRGPSHLQHARHV